MHGLRLVASPDRWLVFPGGELSGRVAARVRDLAAGKPAPDGQNPYPVLVEKCRAVLESELGETRVVSAPIYWIDRDIPAEPIPGVEVVTSADGGGRLRHAARPGNWDEEEWQDLVTGRLGPWAMAIANGTVVSICHTPGGLTLTAAECGVWTHPDHRGQRLAGATTAAWAKLVRAPRRSIFYCTDDRNTASQQVAARLGLRQIGRQYSLDAAPLSIGDAWGQALLDHCRGVWVPPPELEIGSGQIGDAMHPEWFFRSFEEWDWWDRELLPLVAQGPALDLGAGAGRASLWLQEQGATVTAVDSSAGAVDVCRLRGVNDARVGDLRNPPTDQRWRTILLLCGNLGLAGSWQKTRALLARLAEVSAPDAAIVGDTVEPGGPPEADLRIRYKAMATPWWRQLNVPVTDVPALVAGTGWCVDRHLIERPDHSLLLRRA